ncbi:claudin domain-containing protein 1-like [Tachypleus tridentatus]|uniref:claudin domain-containing protein 1-like n=1 Tax=Tachypleus tridentatus TaxID=6853 RepID=UPI003FD5612E
MACSAVTLSLATIAAVVAVACLAIGFGTDNWYEIRVNRTFIRKILEGNEIALKEMEEDMRYFDRDEGLFRICFPDKKPLNVKTYISPVQTECVNIDYFIPENEISDTFSDTRWTRLHMARSVIGLYITAFFLIFLSFFTGVAGCWKRSHGNVVATGILELLVSLIAAGAMGLWHGVNYFDYQKLQDKMSYFEWPDILKQPGQTKYYYGWSYILAWIGVGMNLISAILFLCGARCLRKEKKIEQAKNMQYLMPVYPDKRQPYGYGYGYPGPYYQYGYGY